MNNGFYITATATEQILGETANQLKNQVDDLQQRINKAIEYIENNQLYEDLTEYDDEINFSYVDDLKATKYLLSILKGEKNE